MQIGMQMFTLKEFMQTERDMEYTLAKMAEIGYKIVQISGIGPIDPKKLRAICDKNDLKIVLTHNPAERFLDDIDQLIEDNNILGCDYIGLGSMAQKYRKFGFTEKFVEDFKAPAAKIKEAGKLFMYHNHAFEFEKFNGKCMMDVLVDGFGKDEMGFTLDTYWVQEGGADVIDWLNKLQGRMPCVHLKDMGIHEGQKVMMPIYEGNINFDKVRATLEAHGDVKYALIEQDRCLTSPFDCAQVSYTNLIKNGWKA